MQKQYREFPFSYHNEIQFFARKSCCPDRRTDRQMETRKDRSDSITSTAGVGGIINVIIMTEFKGERCACSLFKNLKIL